MEASLSVFTFAYLGAIRMDNNVTGNWCQFVHVTELTIRRTKNIMAETVYYIDFILYAYPGAHGDGWYIKQYLQFTREVGYYVEGTNVDVLPCNAGQLG